MQDLTPEEKQLGEYLIGSLDDDGLLRKTTEALMDELAIYQGIYTTPNNWSISCLSYRILILRE